MLWQLHDGSPSPSLFPPKEPKKPRPPRRGFFIFELTADAVRALSWPGCPGHPRLSRGAKRGCPASTRPGMTSVVGARRHVSPLASTLCCRVPVPLQQQGEHGHFLNGDCGMLTTHWRWITALWIVSAVVGTTWGLLSVPTGHDSYNQYASLATQLSTKSKILTSPISFSLLLKLLSGGLVILLLMPMPGLLPQRSSCSLRLSCLPLSPGSKTKRQNLN